MQTPWVHRFAQRTKQMKSSAIRELLKLTEQPDVISFAGGLPAPEVFPSERIKEACNKILDEKCSIALQYGTTEGYSPLREMIAEQTSRMGVKIEPDNVLITSGSQQALDLVGRIFINPGDQILVEAPTYLGALQAWNAYGADYVTIPTDQDGMITDELEKALRLGPKFIYVLPNFQNPTGITLSLERRKKLVEISDKFGVPIIEDDPYGQLRFEGKKLPAVVVVDSQCRPDNEVYSGNVIYLGTFSKILAPGLRLGWVIAPQPVIQKMVMAKQGADLHTATFNQILAYEVGKDNFISNHIEIICKVYKERRDVMLESLEKYMPEGVKWTHPQGGLFLWLTLPEEISSWDIFEEAVSEKVAFVPGESFYPSGGGQNTMRLNFSNPTPEKIEEGIIRLARVIKNHISEPVHLPY